MGQINVHHGNFGITTRFIQCQHLGHNGNTHTRTCALLHILVVGGKHEVLNGLKWTQSVANDVGTFHTTAD